MAVSDEVVGRNAEALTQMVIDYLNYNECINESELLEIIYTFLDGLSVDSSFWKCLDSQGEPVRIGSLVFPTAYVKTPSDVQMVRGMSKRNRIFFSGRKTRDAASTTLYHGDTREVFNRDLELDSSSYIEKYPESADMGFDDYHHKLYHLMERNSDLLETCNDLIQNMPS